MRTVNGRKHAVAFVFALVLAGFSSGLYLVAGSSTLAKSQAVEDATILGTVRSVDGEPLFRVAVSATRIGQNAQGLATGTASVPGRGLTNAEGNYELVGLVPGRYSVSAGFGIPSGATDSGVLDAPSGAVLTVDFTMPPAAARSRVVNGKMTLNAESVGKPLPNRLTFVNATVATHADGTLTALMPPGMRRITVHAPDGYFVDTVTAGSAVIYSVHELQRTPNPMAFSIAIPLEPNPTPQFVIALGTRTTPAQRIR